MKQAQLEFDTLDFRRKINFHSMLFALLLNCTLVLQKKYRSEPNNFKNFFLSQDNEKFLKLCHKNVIWTVRSGPAEPKNFFYFQ